MGARYPEARELTITADCGGSNGARVRLWKVELQKLADETGLAIKVRHYPPGRRNGTRSSIACFAHHAKLARPAAHRSRRRGRTERGDNDRTGLKVESALDTRTYEKGIKVSDAEMKRLDIRGDASILSGTIRSCRGYRNRSGIRNHLCAPPPTATHYPADTVFCFALGAGI